MSIVSMVDNTTAISSVGEIGHGPTTDEGQISLTRSSTSMAGEILGRSVEFLQRKFTFRF